ncbi:MAG: TonB-dependent receptor [Xanthomonadales bacterium]|nr:TonB-dependent receptor [Gammaproteobacteria bacterium]MBT8074379.1 TonB-dependent receptor [Gammaproteobacteria bacterium]NNK05231.1 TonB-dependent receptor [Xanthomonadales bacterium]NNK97834.1 TonB-dependent receptor [Xanthomonadales bacterium]
MIKTETSKIPGNTCLLTSSIRIALAAMCMSVFASPQVFAQDQAADDSTGAQESDVLEEVVVVGTRQLIQDSISIKRDSVLVVDGLSASDIGELPALSIGEALESLTGVASHRENGGATEVSIRGLGPFLSATTFNGREATNGSGDRSVNFSQFPSELMNKIAVYKTQNAALIEGGVAGVIALETLKPLDYGKRRIQAGVKGNYNPDQQNINADLSGDLGWRGTFSYVDQFEFDNGGVLGIGLGYQKSDISQPEQEIRGSSPTGSSIYACINDPGVTNEGFFRSSSGDCEDQVGGSRNQGYNTEINPDTGLAYSDGLAFGFAPSSRGYRQNDTNDERDAFFGALQWQPNEDWDINLDFQDSKRTQSELRHDLNIANQKRATNGVTGPALVTTPLGAITNWLGTTAIESNSEAYSREEKYRGYGLNMAWDVNDRLRLIADFSNSKTTRIEKQVSVRMQSDNQDIYGDDTPAGYRPTLHWDLRNGFPQFTIQDFDVTDPTLFSDEYRTRIDSDVDRTNEIQSARLDFQLETDWGGITSLEGGIRYSKLTYLNLGGTRFDPGTVDDSSEAERQAIIAMNESCRIEFKETGFLGSEYGSGDLITVVDEDGNQISGSGDTWAVFDNQCITEGILAFQGEEFAYPEQFRESSSTTDVTETTMAGYLMANFQTEVGSKTVSGDFGVRVVDTDVKSTAWRAAYVITQDVDGFYSIDETGDLEKDTAKYGYTEWLPSVNAVMDLSDTVLLRGAVYRSMSRADPGDLGWNRSFNTNTSDDIIDPEDLITSVSGSGNPATDPLMSWNFDASIEWYPNDDSILTFGYYYKKFQGGFVAEQTLEAFVVDGVEIIKPVTVTQTDGDTSTLWGIEVTAAHNFSYLPGVLSGLGAKIGYNYGNSNFEFEDSNYGDLYITDLEGDRVQTNIGIVAPGNVPGFSDNVFSGTVYWGLGGFDASLIYKYRSEYFQPYTSNGTRLRYVGDVGVWEARMSYAFNEHISISVEGINLFNEPKQTYYYTNDNFGERNVYGPRYFFGIRGKW